MSCGCKPSSDGAACSTSKIEPCGKTDICGNSYKLSVFDWLSGVTSNKKEDCNLVEVRFKNDRKLLFKNNKNLPLSPGTIVTVEGSPGHDVGIVSLVGELVAIQKRKKDIKDEEILQIYRLSNAKDIEDWHFFREKERAVQNEARRLAEAHRLPMKISDVEFQADGAKIIFFYTSETRIDFRQLIKDLATTFKTKIDMRQIGFRQEAAKLGGIGICGRELCCSSWLTDFRSVNTNAARYQQLSINPQKLAGQCGKLKCCLNYELDSYMDSLSHFPPSNSQLLTEKGKAFCIKIDVFKGKMWFAYADKSMAWYDLDTKTVTRFLELNAKGEKCPALEEYVQKPVEKKSVDLIQENSVDRFEKKHHRKAKVNTNFKEGSKSNSYNKKKQVIENAAPENTVQKQGPKPNTNVKGKVFFKSRNKPSNG